MLFVIDIGNSHTVAGLYEDDRLVGQWRLKSDRNNTADELAISYSTLFAMAGIDARRITDIVIASVVPKLETAWVNCCREHLAANLRQSPLIISAATVGGLITIRTDNPGEVGADRLVNGIAAWDHYRSDLIVIDFGTAITFDCVTARCEYIGGIIFPGIGISLEALATRTAKLPHIDVAARSEKLIGTTTVEAMRSGILFGYGAMIDGLVKGIGREMAGEGNTVEVIATGGMAELISPYAELITHIEPNLTLEGLRIIYEKIRNR
ncbi:type III pantothenate kinase [Desulfoprunum benzoelyticum]|uniref:Type III pantothenate kinase n=1 Tax=Desulfoprunum benzoelyticum TaxID=1506996 RepID=A0A840UYC6_9BACT|nr:type III pantothenate kinase [Desulfoprunum benzoelyticum]MBB5346500.1 type III pantothenate kinase [Desulfoprunum benzoelyticum]MBM9528971.1 type III pantothenate kinase [Desulfoprunum benzoelyticum]